MKNRGMFWLSLLVILAVFLSACGFAGLFSSDSSGSGSDRTGSSGDIGSVGDTGSSGGTGSSGSIAATTEPQPVQVEAQPTVAEREAQQAPAPAARPATAQKRIVLVGDDRNVDTEQAARLLVMAGDYQVTVNSSADSADLVLFFVSAPDGPMPRTIEQIERRIGENFQRGAILLTKVNEMKDEELLALVALETQEALGRYLPGGEDQAKSWPVLRSNSADLAAQLEDLFNTPGQAVALQPRREVAQAPAPPTQAGPKRIVLIGDRTDGEAVLPLIQAAGNYEVSVDDVLDHSDLVLFFVSAVDGPMVNTTTEINNRRGEPFPRAAFLLTRDNDNNDAELQALIAQETREIMRGFLPNGEADAWPVLLSTSPDLAAQIQDLLNAPEDFKVLQ